MIYRVTNIICVPKSNTKILSDSVLAYALKRNPASLHPRYNLKEKGHLSIEVTVYLAQGRTFETSNLKIPYTSLKNHGTGGEPTNKTFATGPWWFPSISLLVLDQR